MFESLRMRECTHYLDKTDHCLLAVRTSSKKVAALVNKIEAAHLKSMAKVAHGVTNNNELKHWTSQSIRVGSCVLLSKGNHNCNFVKIHLRCKLESFLLFLWNTVCIDVQFSDTMSYSRNLGAPPLFFSMLPSHGHLHIKLSLAAQQLTTMQYGRTDEKD